MSTSAPVSLVTGAASGIGRALVGAMIARGYRVVATDLDERALERAAEDGWDPTRTELRPLDVRDAEAWEAATGAAVERWGRLDVCSNVAGYLRPGRIVDVDEEEIHRHLDVNARGVVLGTRAAARLMVAQGAGHIVNIGSLASIAPVPGLSLYTASKFAVRGFTLAAASELRPRGVHVSLVLPDAVETPMLDVQVAREEAALTFSGRRPLTVDEVTRVVLDDVLRRRPLEIAIPPSRGRLAKLSGVLPQLNRYLEPLLTRKGRAAQRRRKG